MACLGTVMKEVVQCQHGGKSTQARTVYGILLCKIDRPFSTQCKRVSEKASKRMCQLEIRCRYRSGYQCSSDYDNLLGCKLLKCAGGGGGMALVTSWES